MNEFILHYEVQILPMLALNTLEREREPFSEDKGTNDQKNQQETSLLQSLEIEKGRIQTISSNARIILSFSFSS